MSPWSIYQILFEVTPMNYFTDPIQAKFKFKFCSVVKNMVPYVIKNFRICTFLGTANVLLIEHENTLKNSFRKKYRPRKRKTSPHPSPHTHIHCLAILAFKRNLSFPAHCSLTSPSTIQIARHFCANANLLSMLSTQYSLTIKNCRLIFKIYKEKNSRKTSIN